MGLTKAEIITRISEKNGVSKNDATNIVEATFDIIKASLERGEKVRIQNFGKFSVRTKNQRRGRNPQTGGEIVIPGHKVVTFAASLTMKESVKGAPSGLCRREP